MSSINKSAREVIDRLKAINYDEPYWNEKEVVKALKKQYDLLNVPMPAIVVANNAEEGASKARGAAWDAAWGAARGAARDAAWGAARGAAWGAARGAARDAAWDAARGAARDAAWGAARGAAWDAAWGAARGAARDAAWGAGVRNTGLTDPASQKYIEISTQDLKALENGLGFYFPMKDSLVLVPVPRMIMSGDRLHYDHGKAVEWKDGTGYYFLQGVQFEEDLYDKIISQKMTAEEVLTIQNADQRAAAMSMLRPDRLLKQMNAELINTGIKGTKLYRVKNFMDTRRTEYCMHMIDASSPREFIEWVEPKLGKLEDADLCQAKAFGISKSQYLAIEHEG